MWGRELIGSYFSSRNIGQVSNTHIKIKSRLNERKKTNSQKHFNMVLPTILFFAKTKPNYNVFLAFQ